MTCWDAWYSCAAFLKGMCRPSPPSLAGNARRVRSKLPGGGHAGILRTEQII